MRKGCTAPSHVWEPYTEAEIQALIALRPQVVQVLVHHQQPDWVWAAQKFQLQDLHRAIGCEFEYRMCGVGPSETPQYAVTWLEDKLSGLPVGKIIPFNEPNLPGEGWVGTDWIVWAEEFAREWKVRGFADKLITPAMSPSADHWILETNKMAQLVQEGVYDYYGLHVYLLGSDVMIPNGVPTCITECNGYLPSAVFNSLSSFPSVQEAVWFSSKWLNPDPGYHWDLIGNQQLSDSFKSWKQEANMAEFRFGVLDEANRLRAAGVDVGEPLTEEYFFTPELGVQFTTAGAFWIRHYAESIWIIQFYPKAAFPLA